MRLRITSFLLLLLPHVAAAAASHLRATGPEARAATRTNPTRRHAGQLEEGEASSEPVLIAALRSIASSRNAHSEMLVANVLERGSSEGVLVEALRAAGFLKAPSLSRLIAPYVRHRSEEIARGAVRALSKTGGHDAIVALENSLRSSDPLIRGRAASALGMMGVREALPDLFRALDRGVAEAAAAIGQLCLSDECQRFADLTGRIPFDIVTTGLDQILFRPPSEISDVRKIQIIHLLRSLGTKEVGAYVQDVLERYPLDWSSDLSMSAMTPNRAGLPCERVPGESGGECSPDGKWQAASTVLVVNIRKTKFGDGIASPTPAGDPHVKVELSSPFVTCTGDHDACENRIVLPPDLAPDGQRISVTVRTWSRPVKLTLTVQAERIR